MKSDTEYALDALEDAQKIMIERGKSYKGNQGKTAQVLDILFKDVTIRNVYDRKRYKIISNIVEKLCRYVLNWNKNGHRDSTADGTNYFCLLEAADRQNEDEIKELKNSISDKPLTGIPNRIGHNIIDNTGDKPVKSGKPS
jgi:hypothetical protein